MREAEQIVSAQGAAECPPCSCQTMLGRKMRAQCGSSCISALHVAEWHAGQHDAACTSALLLLLHPSTDHLDRGTAQESTLSGLSRCISAPCCHHPCPLSHTS